MLNLLLAAELSKEKYLYCFIGALAVTLVILIIYFSVRAAKYRKSLKNSVADSKTAEFDLNNDETDSQAADSDFLQNIAEAEEQVEFAEIPAAATEQQQIDIASLLAAEIAADEIKAANSKTEIAEVEASIAAFVAQSSATITIPFEEAIGAAVAVKTDSAMLETKKAFDNKKLLVWLDKLEDDVLAYRAELDVFNESADLEKLSVFDTELSLLDSVLAASGETDQELLLNFSLRKSYLRDLLNIMSAAEISAEPISKNELTDDSADQVFAKTKPLTESVVAAEPKNDVFTAENFQTILNQQLAKQAEQANAAASSQNLSQQLAAQNSQQALAQQLLMQQNAAQQLLAQQAAQLQAIQSANVADKQKQEQFDSSAKAQQIIDEYSAKIKKTFDALNTSSKIALRKAQLTNILTDLKLATSFAQLKEVSNRFYILQSTLDSEEVLSSELTTLINSVRLEILRTADENYYSILMRRTAAAPRHPQSRSGRPSGRPTSRRPQAPMGSRRPLMNAPEQETEVIQNEADTTIEMNQNDQD